MSEKQTTEGDTLAPWARVAINVAPLGSRSGDARWAAAQMIRQQQDEIERLRAALLRITLLVPGPSHGGVGDIARKALGIV